VRPLAKVGGIGVKSSPNKKNRLGLQIRPASGGRLKGRSEVKAARSLKQLPSDKKTFMNSDVCLSADDLL
jgi:hypothetical protein